MYNHVPVCFDWCVGVLQVLRLQRAVPPGTLAAFVEENERVPQGPTRSRVQFLSAHTLITRVTFACVRFWLHVEVSGGQWTC